MGGRRRFENWRVEERDLVDIQVPMGREVTVNPLGCIGAVGLSTPLLRGVTQPWCVLGFAVAPNIFSLVPCLYNPFCSQGRAWARGWMLDVEVGLPAVGRWLGLALGGTHAAVRICSNKKTVANISALKTKCFSPAGAQWGRQNVSQMHTNVHAKACFTAQKRGDRWCAGQAC